MSRFLTMASKFDRYRRQSRIKTNSNYIDRMSWDHFHKIQDDYLFFKKNKRELIVEGLKK